MRYYHLVFTLPHILNGWLALHPEVLYRLLFECVWATLKAFGRDPKRLNGTLGMTCVPHTWGQTLCRHVHLYCLAPGGALSDQGRWHPPKSNSLFPVKALSRHFRGRTVSARRQAAKAGELHRVNRPGEIDGMLDQLMQSEWVVYTQAWLRNPETGSIISVLTAVKSRFPIGGLSESRTIKSESAIKTTGIATGTKS